MLAFTKKIIASFSHKERISFFLALTCGTLAILILGVLKLEGATTAVPARGGDYTEGLVGQPAYVNPVLASTDIDRSLVHLLFSNIPALAQKIEPSDKNRAWDIRLKENLIWQDGEKLTSDDVLFTIQKIQDLESRSPLMLSWQGIVARRVSELEFTLQLPSPYAFFMENLANLFVLPKHLFADIPPSNWRLSAHNLKPIGSGPYRFESMHQQPDGFIDHYELRASPPGGGSAKATSTPNIAMLSLEFFRTTDEALKSFNAGKVDGIGGVEANLLGSIQRPYTLHRFSTPSYYAMFFNPTHSPALRDPLVRAALEKSADRAALVEHILHGYALPRRGPIAGIEEGTSSPALPELIQTLEGAGWNVSTSSDARVKWEGTKEKRASTTLSATVIVPQVSFLMATAEALRDTWANLGFITTLRPVPPEEVFSSVIKNRDYDMLLFGNVLNPPEDLFPFWHSSERFYPGLNISLYNNRKADALMEEIREETDADVRAKKLQTLEALIESDAPATFLYSPEYLFVTAKNVGGVAPRAIANPPERFSNISEWYVKTARVLK